MTVPHRRSLFATLPAISLVVLVWAACASAAGAQGRDHLLSVSAPRVMSPLACDATVVDSIADPAELDTFTITIPVDQVISVSLAALPPVAPNFYPAWRLRDVHQNLVYSFTVGSNLLLPLPA